MMRRRSTPSRKPATLAWPSATTPTATVISRSGYSLTWTSYDHPSTINSAGESVQFTYNQNHERWRAAYTGAAGTKTTYYIGEMLEKVVTAGASDYRHYIYAGATKIAVYSRTSARTNTLRYIREDHQGGVAGIINADGTSYVKENFTAFGNRRSTCTWSGSPTSGSLALITAATRRVTLGRPLWARWG